MNVSELLEKYRVLVFANRALQEENETLKARLGLAKVPVDSQQEPDRPSVLPIEATGFPERKTPSISLDPTEKIRLFMSLFKGREDVYAKRWQNREGRAGYAPVCRNEWQSGICRKPTIKCFDCPHQAYDPLDETVIEAHLRGGIVAGLYPLLRTDDCHLLAMDFDDQGWQEDCAALREVCETFGLPIALERSRSGNGAHVWFFFVEPLPAALARKFGSALLTCAMSQRHELSFKSYDRFFPNQDTLPKGGFGNLIALPLQKSARERGNSVFVMERFSPYEVQWAFGRHPKLSLRRWRADPRLSPGNEWDARKDEVEHAKPWKRNGYGGPERFRNRAAVKANLLYIEKAGFATGLNNFQRLPPSKTRSFTKRKPALPTSTSPGISCSDENPDTLHARGCKAEPGL